MDRFVLTGQMDQMAGSLFSLVFTLAAVIIAFSTYSYIEISNVYPSACGIVLYLQKA